MKISVKNFKSLGSLLDFELRPLTILSGNNSSGKSSFLQLLLLLKQTLEIDSSKYPLLISGKYYSAKSVSDLVKDKVSSNQIEVGFFIDKSEFEALGDRIQKSLFDNFPKYTANLQFSYATDKDELFIDKFEVSYQTEIKKEILVITNDKPNDKIKVETNNEYFLKFNYEGDENENVFREFLNIDYSAFFPKSFEESIKTLKPELPPDENGETAFTITQYLLKPNIDSLRSFIENYFNGMFYIGPLRIEPQDAYVGSTEIDWVGIKGEHTAHILESRKDEPIKSYLPLIEGDLMKFELKETSLIEATNIWICQIFKFANKLYSKEVGDSYTVILENKNGIETTIKHVGFGISQVLPIIVQGLLMNKGETLILEQPEIHLHPKIQSYLFDFLHSLILKDSNVIVETHSDHLITRMRRRVAEDESSYLNKSLSLTFIEQGKDDLSFTPINIDELGIYNIFPEDFIESPEKELRALLKAQMKKRKSTRD